ncbi:endonuclease/exonuclease/phosphatase family protein [Candidatus Kaiserbacteria bacterium]|nr:endonuclease/exonuclease/phosphatase family protein [Candidatus Kaiserbacteria bacterium]
MRLKVLSWNIWIDGNFKQLVDFLETQDADVIGLQEVKDDDTERPVLAFLQNHGYQYVFMPVEKKFKDKVYRDGPAVFSKFPINSSQTHNLSREDSRGAAQADIQVNGKILHVFSTHFLHTHQKPSKNQDEQADTLLTLLPQEHTILMGDFNATPESYPIQKLSSVLKNTDTSSAPTKPPMPKSESRGHLTTCRYP